MAAQPSTLHQHKQQLAAIAVTLQESCKRNDYLVALSGQIQWLALASKTAAAAPPTRARVGSLVQKIAEQELSSSWPPPASAQSPSLLVPCVVGLYH